jgi:hypothetical protein
MTQPELWEPSRQAPQTTADLEARLAGFIGTTRYYRNFIGLLYTDGVRQMAELARAYWLIDVVASYQPRVRVPFQLWHIGVRDTRAIVTMREDSRLPVLVEQHIPFTDFPEGTFELYCASNVLMLKSEY